MSPLLLTRRERLTQSWRKLSASGENALVPQTHLSGPMPWMIAIMVALTVIAAAAGLALRNTAKATEAELSGGATVQIVEAAPKARQDQAEKSIEHLRDFPGVTSIRLVPEEEIAALIEPWLGVESGGEDVPVPALIDVSMQGKVTTDRIAALQASLRKVAPAARVDAQSTWLKPVFDAIESLQWLALALVALLALAMAAAVLLAARTALGTNRDTIEIVHLLGGTDHQIARVFQRSIGFDAAGGGTVGLALGMVVVLFLGRRFAGLGTGMVDGGALQWIDWLILALIPIVGVVLAMVTARITVMRTLREML